jgi:hypothetical protein
MLADNGTLGKVDKDMTNMRDGLDAFLKGGGDAKVAEAVIAQVSAPDTITQANDTTCAAATAQKAMAQSNPGQYAKVVGDLMTKGETTLPDGQKMTLTPENKEFLDKHPEMPLEQRINATFQAAAMDLGNAHDKYSLATDTSHHEDDMGTAEYKGLSVSQAKRVNEALLGCPSIDGGALNNYVSKTIDENKKSGKQEKVFDMMNDYVKAQFDAAKDSGSPGVFVTLHSGSERMGGPGHMMDEPEKHYHEVMVKDIDDKGNVTMIDAQGSEMTMSKDDFANHIAMDNADGQALGGIGDINDPTMTQSVASGGYRRR